MGEIMRKITAIIPVFLMLFALGSLEAAAQFNIRMPEIKIKKPDQNKDKDKDSVTTNTTNNNTIKTKTSGVLYKDERPTSVPVLMKNTIYVQAHTHDEYWKMPGKENYSSWVPEIRFSQYYNEEK